MTPIDNHDGGIARRHNGNSHDALRRVSAQLSRLELEHERGITRFATLIDLARQRGAPTGELERQRGEFERMSAWAISQTTQERDALQATLDAERDNRRAAGRVALEAVKGRALADWLDAGGTERGFTEAWPSMEAELLKSRILDALEKTPA